MTPASGSMADAALRGALVAALLLVGTALARERSSHAAARVGLALLLGLLVQTLASSPLVEHGWPITWQAPLVGVSVGNAMLFWLFARSLFDDDFAVRARHLAGWAAVAAIGASFCLSLALLGPQSPVTVVLRLALRWVPAGFALLVIAAAASEWRADLVERRRRLRGFIVIAGAAYTAVMVAVRLAMPYGALSATAAGFDTAALLVIVLVVGVAVLRVSDDGLLPAAEPADKPAGVRAVGSPARAVPGTPPDPAEGQLAEALARLMQHERVYRIDDLTLGVLALKLGVPEYRLRRCINRRLGHRNFNAYVNALRLAQAREALADPARREASVLEIAMDAGFGSIGPFNRAFKAASGLTPSEFRRQALADS